ncbi:hypothetical protein ABZY03_15420 [Streptomyces klenkii]|uniref:hypothetical protein n=1 Tax=Streptomyces klenkii TaxID=1420899 RepID=UPI0033AC08BF
MTAGERNRQDRRGPVREVFADRNHADAIHRQAAGPFTRTRTRTGVAFVHDFDAAEGRTSLT